MHRHAGSIGARPHSAKNVTDTARSIGRVRGGKAGQGLKLWPALRKREVFEFPASSFPDRPDTRRNPPRRPRIVIYEWRNMALAFMGHLLELSETHGRRMG